MAYLKHQAHPPGTQNNGSGVATETEDPPRGRGLGIAVLVWAAGFAVLAVTLFWDLIAALFFRS